MNQTAPDRYILIIKDAPYGVTLNKDEGLVNQTVDADLEVKERWYTINGKKIPEVNILWHVKGITQETASGLDTKEQILLLKDYLHGKKTISSIKKHPDISIVLAKEDYDIAVSAIFAKQPDYNASCQASLRFARRILKAKLKSEDRGFEDGHSLTRLAEELDERDLKEIEEIIPWIQKSQEEGCAGARETLEDAVNAVRSSVALFSVLFTEKKDDKKSRGYINISS